MPCGARRTARGWLKISMGSALWPDCMPRDVNRQDGGSFYVALAESRGCYSAIASALVGERVEALTVADTDRSKAEDLVTRLNQRRAVSVVCSDAPDLGKAGMVMREPAAWAHRMKPMRRREGRRVQPRQD